MSTRKININDLYHQYPCVGTITEWHSDGGWGKIRYAISNSRLSKFYFAHFSGYRGYQDKREISRLDLSGERCIFSIGVSPHKYDPTKHPNKSALTWILAKDIDDNIDQYYELREIAISQWNLKDLFHALQAEWYVSIWKNDRENYSHPDVKLDISTDKLLDEKTRNYGDGIEDFQEWKIWLEIKLSSPFFAVNQSQRNVLKSDLLEILQSKKKEFFQGVSADSFLAFYLCHQEDFNESWFWKFFSHLADKLNREDLSLMIEKLPESDEFFNLILKTLTDLSISLDVESDSVNVYQIGWWESNQNHLEDKLDSQAAVSKCLKNIESQLQNRDIQWLTGHNIIQWDLPILRKFNKNFLSNVEIWDTLLISWILEPWHQSHALVAGKNAHRADVDAKAAIKKLQEQLKRFPQLFLKDQCLAPQNPIDVIFLDSKILDQVIERKYPSLSGVKLNLLLKETIVVPKWRILKEFAWRPSVIYCYAGVKILSAELLTRAVHSKPNNYALKALACVVSHATQHNVQVTTEMVPPWLEEQVGDILESCIEESRFLGNPNIQKRIRVMTYEYFRNNLDSLTSEYNCLHPEEGYLAELNISHAQKSWQIASLLGNQEEYYDSHVIFRVNEHCSGLEGIRDIDLNRQSLWIEYNPVFARQEGYRSWKAYRFWQHRALPNQFQIRDKPKQSDKHLSVALPSLSSDNPLPCTSRNRSLYWRDTLLRFLSLLQTSNNDSTFVLLVAHRHEVEPLMAALEQIQQTRSKKEHYTTLRYLEHLHNSGKRLSCHYCAVDHQSNAHNWLEASQALGYPVQLVFDSLPLHEWWMQIAPEEDALESFDDANDSIIEDQGEDESSLNTEENENLDIDNARSRRLIKPSIHSSYARTKKQFLRVHLSPSNIQSCIEYGLWTWLRIILRRDPENMPEVAILDVRCHPASFRNVCSIHQPLSAGTSPRPPIDQNILLEELRKELGGIERQDAPTGYENYETFLKAYWGYGNFRESQVAALKAIITNQQDVLVRLPTGEGKSVLFHIPALLRGRYTQRLTIVITPLKALMADQVLSLWNKGFFDTVDYLSSDRSPWEMDEIYQGIIDNRIKLLFLAPERFRVNRFREAIDSRYQSDQGFEYIVVDEAHCISQWGFEFRPDYLYAMEEIRDHYRLPNSDGRRTPILLFSATVTQAVQTSLEEIIGIQEEDRDKTYIVQPPGPCKPIQDFLELEVERVSDGAYGRDGNLLARKGFVENALKTINPETSSAIIFATRRYHAENFVEVLNAGDVHDIKFDYFHAGLSAEVRADIYESFKNKDINVLISTKAFGMGMDIPHIHFCIHLTPPSSLEDYLQEVGRVGRSKEDREKAELSTIKCKLLYADDDFSTNHAQIQSSRITRPKLISLWKEILNQKRTIRDSNQEICVVPVDSFGELKDSNILRNAIFWLERLERISLKEQFGNLLKVKLNRKNLEMVSNQDSEIQPIARLLLLLYTNSGMVEYLDNSSHTTFDARRAYIGFLIQSSESGQSKTFSSGSWDEAELNLEAILEALDICSMSEVFGLLLKLSNGLCLKVVQEIEFTHGKLIDDKDQMLDWLNYSCHKILDFQNLDQGIPLETLEQYFFQQMEDQPEGNWSQKKIEIACRKVIRSAIKLLRAAGVRIKQETSEEENLLFCNIKDVAKINRKLHNFRESIQKILLFLQDKTIVTLDNFWQDVNFQGSLPIKPHNLKEFKAILSILSSLDLYKSKQDLTSRSYLIEISNPEKYQGAKADNFTDQEKETLAELDRVNTFAILRSYAVTLYAKLPDSKTGKFIDDYFKVSTPEDMIILLEEIAQSSYNENENLQELINQVKEEAISKLAEKLKTNPQQDLVSNYPYHQHSLVNAGPGSGKTYVLVSRCVLLIHKQQLQPQDILVLAFNRAVVYEIRKRVNQVFSELGYGEYAKRLKVFTFHGLAKKYMNNSSIQQDGIDEILKIFVRKMKEDALFRREVASSYKAIMVDEFQDMTQDFFDVIIEIQRESGAGLMVIGDDDQDILLWNRKKNKEQHLSSNYYFDELQRTLQSEILNLTFNYRSAPEIVDKSQEWINRWLGKERRKADIHLEASPFKPGIVGEFSPDDITTLIQEKLLISKDIAILCRANSEVSDLYERLKFLEDEDLCRVKIKQDADLRLAQIREVAEWIDICEVHPGFDDGDTSYGNQPPDDLVETYRQLPLPDISSACELISHLWDISSQNSSRLTLRSHVEQLKELKLSEASRLIQKREDKTILTISTINSVKGLEFDIVFIYPSKASFPFGESWSVEEENNLCTSLEEMAREEKKLYYVAATRAKGELYYSPGEREKSWSQSMRYEGRNGDFRLNGSPGEVIISWPGYENQNNPENDRYNYSGAQGYIREKVQVNDSLRLVSDQYGRVILSHGNCWIAQLESQTAKKIRNFHSYGYSLRVSAIYRYPVTAQEIAKEKPDRWKYFDKVKAQGWLYTVLVSGRIGTI